MPEVKLNIPTVIRSEDDLKAIEAEIARAKEAFFRPKFRGGEKARNGTSNGIVITRETMEKVEEILKIIPADAHVLLYGYGDCFSVGWDYSSSLTPGWK